MVDPSPLRWGPSVPDPESSLSKHLPPSVPRRALHSSLNFSPLRSGSVVTPGTARSHPGPPWSTRPSVVVPDSCRHPSTSGSSNLNPVGGHPCVYRVPEFVSVGEPVQRPVRILPHGMGTTRPVTGRTPSGLPLFYEGVSRTVSFTVRKVHNPGPCKCKRHTAPEDRRRTSSSPRQSGRS